MNRLAPSHPNTLVSYWHWPHQGQCDFAAGTPRMSYPDIIRSVMSAYGCTQAEVAVKLAVTQATVSRWLRGDKPKQKHRDRIMAMAAQAGLTDIEQVKSSDGAACFSGAIANRKVRLIGYVGAGGEAHYYELYDGDYEEVEAHVAVTDRTVAVEIRGKSLGPLLESWLVFYQDVKSSVAPELYDRVCVVGLADKRLFVTKLHNNPDGTFSLVSNMGEPLIENAQIAWAAKVTGMRPKDGG